MERKPNSNFNMVPFMFGNTRPIAKSTLQEQ